MDPFMLACNHGHKDVVKLLLDHSEKIELNARDHYSKDSVAMYLFGIDGSGH